MSERERAGRDWRDWGPYLSERQWGTVREDYSADGEAWDYLTYEQARSRAYRWGEDGLAGFSDAEQRLCLAVALWNGRDEFCKERIFGLTGREGNHGEDAKDYWWFLDAVPSHAWNRWRYHYPQAAFPYAALRDTGRTRADPEYELLDTGVFDDDRYWIVEVDYAKASRHDVLMTVRVTNAGPERESLHVLPTAWFRNTWTWEPESPRPGLAAAGDNAVRVEHPVFGELELLASGSPELLFCENETNNEHLYGVPNATPYPKDGINDHVVSGAASVNPARRGTKCAAWYRVDVAPKSTVEIRLRLRPTGSPLADALGADFDRVVADREREAGEFYAELTPPAASADEAAVMRQAFAGMLWSKQFYNYSVARWLDGDPGQPVPPASRLGKRNSRWRQFDAYDVMSMPDTWEYPWFAAWDLAFHCIALAHVDPGFAKDQLLLVCREWFQHPNGALPAYEWDFGDVNPPVQAWAALEVFAIDGGADLDFLSKVFDKLLVNFTWWVNREDADGSNLFEGGFLGLDNIGPIDRSHLPPGWILEQSDATGWMAMYALAMTTMAAILDHAAQRPAADLVDKFLEHFAAIRTALEKQGMWDDADGLFYDRLVAPGQDPVPMKVHSMVGIVPALAVTFVDERVIDPAVAKGKQFAGFLDRNGLRDPEKLVEAGYLRGAPGSRRLLLSAVGVDRVRRLFGTLFDEREFLSPHGLRSLSAYHREHPYTFEAGELHATVDYQPAESRIEMFGGNSNWRGPVWFPLNYLVTSALERYHRFFGADLTVEYPTGSGELHTLHEVTADLWARLVSIFTVGPDGRRPCFGGVEKLQQDPEWKDNLMFNEYFHGDDAAGLGASHQTGWTGIIADVIRRRHGMVPSVAEIVLGTEDDR